MSSKIRKTIPSHRINNLIMSLPNEIKALRKTSRCGANAILFFYNDVNFSGKAVQRMLTGV